MSTCVATTIIEFRPDGSTGVKSGEPETQIEAPQLISAVCATIYHFVRAGSPIRLQIPFQPVILIRLISNAHGQGAACWTAHIEIPGGSSIGEYR
jgi:hypothetical protein